MKTKDEILTNLAYATGSDSFKKWSILFRNHYMTTGVEQLAQNAQCFYILDAIASYHSQCMKDPMLRDMQFWTFTVHPDHSATLICERDTGDIFLTQEFESTDFPLDQIKIWVSRAGDKEMTVMLPSEY